MESGSALKNYHPFLRYALFYGFVYCSGGARLIKEGAANLKALFKKIDTGKLKAPSFIMVMTGLGNMHTNVRMVYVLYRHVAKDRDLSATGQA